MPFVRRTRAILRNAEFGFLGVIVRTWRQTPRFCGAPGMATCLRLSPFQFLRMAGALTFLILVWRPWRTSWLIVGTKTLLLSNGDGAGGRRVSGGRPVRERSGPRDLPWVDCRLGW